MTTLSDSKSTDYEHTTVQTPAGTVAHDSEGNPTTVALVFSAEALDEYGIDPEETTEVTATVSEGMIQLTHQ